MSTRLPPCSPLALGALAVSRRTGCRCQALACPATAASFGLDFLNAADSNVAAWPWAWPGAAGVQLVQRQLLQPRHSPYSSPPRASAPAPPPAAPPAGDSWDHSLQRAPRAPAIPLPASPAAQGHHSAGGRAMGRGGAWKQVQSWKEGPGGRAQLLLQGRGIQEASQGQSRAGGGVPLASHMVV